MDFLLQVCDDRIQHAVPAELRARVQKAAEKKKMNESMYIKLALINQTEKDLNEAI